MKTYILGMAKSPLQLTKGTFNSIEGDAFSRTIKPGSSRSLELDFLRLVYAAKELGAKGHKVITYLMVATPEVVEKVQKWKEKYEVGEGIVHVVNASLNQAEIRQLIEEKAKNKNANTSNARNKEVNARADVGKGILEDKLRDCIELKHGKREVIQERKEMPFQINWDYCCVLMDSL
jgi:hypothetical protein